MIKFKFFLNYDKEEKWLEEMAAKGYQLKKVVFGYTFTKAQPENAIIRIDFRMFNKKQDYLDYITLFEDSGWQHIAGSRHNGTQYFKKINPARNDDIFSDSSSRAGRYKRLANMWMFMALIYAAVIIVGSLTGDISRFTSVRDWYFTPGLWEMTGTQFWRSFLFETPFVLFRSGLIINFPLIMSAVFFIRARVVSQQSARRS